MSHRLLLGGAFFALILFASRHSSADDATLIEIDLTKQTYKEWRDHVLPAKPDLDWQQIPWLTTFQDGILEADQRNFPLLFWTMNGHPLGCT